jgi:hypothetical protein
MALPGCALPCHQGGVKRAMPYRTASILVCVFVSGFIALTACSDQGEGERCDSLNGSEDCDKGKDLTCFPANLLTNTVSDRCCPTDRSRATSAVCKTPVSGIGGGDATAPADTGPPPGTADATVVAPDASGGTGVSDAANDG